MTRATNVRYTAADITVLEGLEPVRKRPGMYIGSTDDKGLHHLLWEIIDNAVDEYLNDYADAVTVTLAKSGLAATVIDNGRGIPVDLHPVHKKPALELILTTLHSGAKFGEGEQYIHSGGLHGVGSSVVNALSARLVATVLRDGSEWQQSFVRGRATTALKELGQARGHGTTIYFEPDPQIFGANAPFKADRIRAHLEDMSYIHSGLKITFVNEMTKESFDLTHAGGLPEFLDKLLAEGGKPAVHDTTFALSKGNGERMEVALRWTESTDDTFRSYVNGIRTSMGGTHENGLKRAVVKAVQDYMDTHSDKVKTKGLDISAEDIREGVIGLLSVFVRNPQFQGQTKERLHNPEMTAAVESFVRPALETWLNANPSAADQIVGRIVLAARARLASREAAKEIRRKSAATRRGNLPGKLADCQSTRLDESELFIVEGKSAGGNAKQARNNKTQAVLPLRGKVLNSEGLALGKVLTNEELKDLVSALGTGIGDRFDIGGLRYGKIILLMDADADGHHISTLLLAFFFRHLPELIKHGHVFLAQPPLYRIVAGKETHWARDDDHKEEILAKLKANVHPVITRFKGLGEMEQETLGETTMHPRGRTLLRVQIESQLDADRIFVELLGKDPSQRYRYIMDLTAGPAVEELDI
jgi:DNA gyrase/topoisomerase IV subunit B